MRQIKFRAWDKKLNVMWEPIELTKLLRYLFFQIMPNAAAYDAVKEHFDDIVWLEFTGLLDKNGKEIYESDWCRACFRDKEGLHYQQGIIVMDDYMWCLKIESGDEVGEIYSINRLHDFEIIGNIYENPELIRTQEQSPNDK